MNGLRLWWETAVLALIFIGWIGIFWMALAKAMRWDELFVPPLPPADNEDEPEQKAVLLLWPTDGRLH